MINLPAAFLNVQNVAGIQHSDIRRLTASLRIKGGMVEHHKKTVFIRNAFEYPRPKNFKVRIRVIKFFRRLFVHNLWPSFRTAAPSVGSPAPSAYPAVVKATESPKIKLFFYLLYHERKTSRRNVPQKSKKKPIFHESFVF